MGYVSGRRASTLRSSSKKKCKSPWCDFTGDRGSTKSSESDHARTDGIRVYSKAIDEYKKKNPRTSSSNRNL